MSGVTKSCEWFLTDGDNCWRCGKEAVGLSGDFRLLCQEHQDIYDKNLAPWQMPGRALAIPKLEDFAPEEGGEDE